MLCIESERNEILAQNYFLDMARHFKMYFLQTPPADFRFVNMFYRPSHIAEDFQIYETEFVVPTLNFLEAAFEWKCLLVTKVLRKCKAVRQAEGITADQTRKV